MRIWTSTLAATAILAVAVPVGHAVNGNPTGSHRGQGHATTTAQAQKVVKLTLRNNKQTATIRMLKARITALVNANADLRVMSGVLCQQISADQFTNRALDARNTDLEARLQDALATIKSLSDPSPTAPEPGNSDSVFPAFEDGASADIVGPYWMDSCGPGPLPTLPAVTG